MRRLFSTVGMNTNGDDPFEQLKYQLFAAQYRPNSVSSNFNGGTGWDTLYRSPEMKRQIRYRQCYFNPISCFKK